MTEGAIPSLRYIISPMLFSTKKKKIIHAIGKEYLCMIANNLLGKWEISKCMHTREVGNCVLNELSTIEKQTSLFYFYFYLQERDNFNNSFHLCSTMVKKISWPNNEKCSPMRRGLHCNSLLWGPLRALFDECRPSTLLLVYNLISSSL